ncbi:ImmA/IrrE family metallo-endopeptidase [Enterococcus faecium]|uniref:IrrE N-terminal-like domain-containing protein n=1 Tax=Enterococcus faecium TaxID=1352 RepID=A0A242BLK7_ENTFC|nr:ImmA/IrrE family metallo-endopeptidase [Enterococcus faecium]OTN96259.1 hypothetical protein A5810_000594 [Enterococcus faecium]
MKRQIEMIRNELGVKIIENESLDAKGYYVADLNLIVIKSALTEWEKNKTLLHELGYACEHHNNKALYNLTFTIHSKMEYEANKYMIRKLLKHYMENSSATLSEFNYMTFMEIYEIEQHYEEYVKELVLHYVATGRYFKTICKRKYID